MRLRLPLYLRVLLWLFLNVLVLGIVAYVFVKAQFRVGFDSLLLGRAGDRLEALTQLIAAALTETPRERWDEVLDRYGSAYGINCHLVRPGGEAATGAAVDLPPEVRQRLDLVGPRHLDSPPAAAPRGREGIGRGPPAGRGPGARALWPFRGPHPKFMVRTDAPRRYWVGVRLPSPEDGPARGAPLILLFVSESLVGGGLFLDWKPWATLGAGAVAFSVLFWLPFVHRITRSVSQMTRATERMAEGDFRVTVPAERRDELGALARAVNRMASRLDGFVRGQKRFLGDVAHELCSPLARVQMALGVLEQRADDRQRASVEDVREEIQQMSGLVNELLSFSRAGLQDRTAPLPAIPLAPLVRKAVEREGGTATVRMGVDESMRVRADPDLLQRALGNLVRNALRYAGTAGPIEITAEVAGDRVRVRVTDSGPGVPEAELGRIFDPFYRVESSRSREAGGVGLGLAIVRTCVEACQGTVTARNQQPSGLVVEIELAVATT